MIAHNSKYVLLVLITASSILQSYGQEKPTGPAEQSLTWTEFISEEGRFRVLMPDKPKLEVLTYESGNSRLVHNTFTVEKGAFIWLVDFADLPPKSVDPINPIAFFNEARDQLLSETNGTLLQQKPLTLEGHSGLEIKLRLAGGVARVQFYLVNDRLYQSAVTRLDLLSGSEEPMEKFLSSFKILNGRTLPTAMRRSAPTNSKPLIPTARPVV